MVLPDRGHIRAGDNGYGTTLRRGDAGVTKSHEDSSSGDRKVQVSWQRPRFWEDAEPSCDN